MMERRNFIAALAAGLVAASLDAAALVEKLPRVALVFNNIPAAELTDHRLARAFVQGLRIWIGSALP